MIYLFNDVKELTGTVRNNHILNLLYEREKNGIYSVSAEIPVTYNDQGTIYNYNKKIQKSDFLGHYDKEGRFQLHKIAAVDIENGSIFAKGIHIFFDEAKAGAIIKDRRFVNREIIDGARVAFESIGWSVADFDVSVGKTYNFYNVTPLEARQILVETFGFEFDYWLDFDGKKVTNRHVAVKEKIGEKTNKRYTYGHNVLNIRAEQDYSEIYTAVIGRGKGEEIEDTGGYGRRIEYTDVVWSKPFKPLNKPAGTRVLEDPNATQLFGYKENGVVKPRIKVEVFSDIESPTELIQSSYEWLMDNNVPKAVFSLKVADGDGLNLGDEVYVIYRDIDLIKSARVEKVTDDLVSGNRDVEFGDTAYFDTDRRLSGLRTDLKRYSGETGDRIYRLKMEFNRRFDEEVSSWVAEFEQNLIDQKALIEADRENMTNLIEGTRTEFTDNLNAEITQTKEYAEQQAQEKAETVRTDLGTVTSGHQALIDGLEDNVIDIDTFLGDKSKTLEQQFDKVHTDFSTLQTDLDGVESDLTATKTDLQKQLDDARAELEGLEVGGRNLATKSSFAESYRDGEYSWYLPSSVSSAILISSTSDKLDKVSLKGGEEYTVSWDATYEVTQEHVSLRIAYNTESGSVSSLVYVAHIYDSIEGDRLSHTFTAPISSEYLFQLYNRGNEAWVKNLQIHRGNMLLDYQPAPEDTEEKITTLNQQIEFIDGQLSAKLEQTDLQPINNKITEYGNSLTANAQSIESLISKTELHDGDITQWSNETKANAESISQTLTRVEETEAGISQAQIDIQTNADGIAGVIRDVETIDGNLTSLTTDFNVEAGKVETLISKTDGHDTQLTNIVADYESIEQTVAANDEWLGTHGSNVLQTVDGFSQKVWLTDVAEINPNLIPISPNAWEDGAYYSTGNNNNSATENIRLKRDLAVRVFRDVVYTFNCQSHELSNISQWMIVNFDTADSSVNEVRYINRGNAGSLRTVGNRLLVVAFARSGEVVALDSFENNPSSRINIKLERGSTATPLLNVLSHIEQQANEVSIKVSELGSINGEEILTESDIIVRADEIILGSKSISSETMASIISVSPNAINMITDELNLTGNLNVKGQIEAISLDAIDANFARVQTAILKSNVITSDHIQVGTALIDKMFATSARIDELITKTHFVNEMHALTLNVVDLNASQIRTRLLSANTIEAEWLKGGTALLDRVFSSTAMFERMMAKNGFVTTLNTVTIDTDQLTIRRPDGVAWVSQGLARGHVPVQIFDNYADSSVQFSGLNFVTSSSFWKNIKYFYTPHEGSRLRVVWAVSLQTGNSASEYIEVSVNGFGNYNPINNGTGSSTRRQLVYAEQTEYITQDIPLPPPNFQTFQANLQFRRSPTGVHLDNRVTARILHIGQYD